MPRQDVVASLNEAGVLIILNQPDAVQLRKQVNQEALGLFKYFKPTVTIPAQRDQQ